MERRTTECEWEEDNRSLLEMMLSSAVGPSRPPSSVATGHNSMAASASPSTSASSSSAMSVAQTADLWLKIDQGWNKSNVVLSNKCLTSGSSEATACSAYVQYSLFDYIRLIG